MQANMGMAGEFRCVVKRADGSTKIDTGYQKNLILNQGLDFFGGGKGPDMMAYCVIGSGNSSPIYTQNKLDTAIKGVGGADFSAKYDYNAATDGNLYKTNRVVKYSFNELNNVNISELGLASVYNSISDYFLCTRALIKDSSGNPTTITVLSGEILEIYYKLWAVFDTTDKIGQINLLDGVGGSVAYNYKCRIANVGDGLYAVIARYINFVVNNNSAYLYYNNEDIATINSNPSGSSATVSSYTAKPYNAGDYKKTYNLTYGIDRANGKVRTLLPYMTGMMWQIRFGSVADDSPINKTNTQTLSIPIEFSWGRYEGAL